MEHPRYCGVSKVHIAFREFSAQIGIGIKITSNRSGEFMRDETLVEPFAVPEIFVDGFVGQEVHDGVFTCSGYRYQPANRANGEPLKVVVVKIVMPAQNVAEAIELSKAALQLVPPGMVRETLRKLSS